MAVTLPSIPEPSARACIAPLLPALGPATVSNIPPPAILPLFSPILRQRVQLLSSPSTSDPWIKLLCRDPSKVARLAEVAAGPELEPHPSSGEIEVDWENDVRVRYRRVDEETLEAVVVLIEVELAVQLVYCVAEGNVSETGWRIGNVTAADDESDDGETTIAGADRVFSQAAKSPIISSPSLKGSNAKDEDDNDDYWDRYDATPGGRTPAAPRSPGPSSKLHLASSAATAEDAYFAQYESVQPAMDPHDPDEASLPPQPQQTAQSFDSVSDSAAAPSTDFVRQREECGPRSSVRSKHRLSMGSIVEENNMIEEDNAQMSKQINKTHDSNLIQPRPDSGSAASSAALIDSFERAAQASSGSGGIIREHVLGGLASLHGLARAAGLSNADFKELIADGLQSLEPTDESDR